MSGDHFRALDLNLLRVLDTLLDERSVTRAATRLGLTQSAVSHALNRLRRTVDDDLFVRGPGGMLPTPRAEELGAGVRRALLQMQAALEPARFTPAQTERRFTLGGTSYSSVVLMPAVVARLREEAPGAEVRLRHSPATVAEDLDSGRMDLMIGAFARVPERYAFAPLFTERMVWALRADHPAAAAPLTYESLAGVPHLVLGAAEHEEVVGGSVVDHGLERRVIWDEGGALQAELEARGLTRTVAMTAPDALASLAIAAGSDLAALAPERLVARFAGPWKLKAMDPPYPATPLNLGMLWRRDLDSPALVWLRGLLQDAAATL